MRRDIRQDFVANGSGVVVGFGTRLHPNDPLIDEIRLTPADLLDPYAVTALLESSGLRDVDARERYGFPDLFALGRALYPVVGAHHGARPSAFQARPALAARPSFLRSYVGGLAFALPVVSQIITFAIAGYSLWAWTGFTQVQATLIGLALVSSLFLTAPVVQGLVHRGRYYQYAGNARLARSAVRQMIVFAMLVVLAVAAVAGRWAMESEAGRFFLGYFVLLSLLWSSIAAAEAAGLRWLVGPATLIGAALLIALHSTGVPLPIAQWVALGATAGVLVRASEYRLGNAAGSTSTALAHTSLLPLDALVLRVGTAWAYGLAYFAFLFIDHLVNWAAATPWQNRTFQLSGEYETSIAWALATLFVASAALEHPARTFWTELSSAAARTPLSGYIGLGARLQRVWIGHGLTAAATSILAAASVVAVVMALQSSICCVPAAAFAQPVLLQVLIPASLGYALFVVGLGAAVFLHALRRTGTVAVCLTLAALTDLAVGLLATQLSGRESSVLGLLVGAIVFVSLTVLVLVRTLRRADFYLALSLS